MNGLTLSELISLLEKVKFDHVTATTGGDDILSGDVPEERIYLPVGIVLSDTSGSSNTVSIDKVEEDDTTTTLIPNFNLAGNESVIHLLSDIVFVIPRLEGDTNLQFTAGANNVEATLLYLENIEI